MNIEEAEMLLADENLELIQLVKEYENASVFLCKLKDGSEVQAVIQNDTVILAPT